MPLDAATLITTVGGSTSNSYVTLAEFLTYCDLRINTESANLATPDNKVRALLTAARRLGLESWLGDRVDGTQSLSWPRVNVPKADGLSSGVAGLGAGYLTGYRTGYGIYFAGYGEVFPSDAIPQQVKDAQCELAIAYLTGFTEESKGSHITQYEMDGLVVKRQISVRGLPDAVDALLSGLTDSGVRLVRQ